MSTDIDVEIYKCISGDMNVAEIYLGHVPFAFYYTKAQYTATCTEAVPFNPFDKVICKLLNIKSSLSLEEIGDILGMNVYESANPKRYLDLAEREILTEALQSLSSPEFGNMIEGGDISFSSCRLTPTGKEYAEKQSKFRTTENKPFTIFFDHTTGDHKQAKQYFEYVDGKLAGKQFSVELIREEVLKEIAAVQVPEIYNPHKQYSFTNAVLDEQKHLSVKYPIAVTFNAVENSFCFYCYDNVNKNIHRQFNQWVNANEEARNELLFKLADIQTGSNTAIDEFSKIYTNQLVEYRSDKKVSDERSSLLDAEFVDEQLFLSYLNETFDPSIKCTLFLCLPTVSRYILQTLIKIIQEAQSADSRFFFIIPYDIDQGIIESLQQLLNIANDEAENLYIIQLEVKSTFLLLKTAALPFYFEMISGEVSGYKKNFLQRKAWDEKAEKIERHFLEHFSKEYTPKLCDEANTLINEYTGQAVTKEQLQDLHFYIAKLAPFKGVEGQREAVEATLHLIENFREQLVHTLEKKQHLQLEEILLKLQKVETELELEEIRKEFERIRLEITSDSSQIFAKSEEIKQRILEKKETFEEARRVYYFILDTNVFLKDPGILSKVKSKDKVIIAAKVIDELDKLKTDSQWKDIAAKSLKAISRSSNVTRARANMKLLPGDFNRRTPYNVILATALMYTHKNGILITNDNDLQEKAKTVEVQAMSYDDLVVQFIN